jgi:hypothetical protein
MWSPAADTIAWSTAGTEQMRITPDGNVGIGTSTTTGVKLTVAGSTAFTFAQFSTAHVVLGSTNSSGSLFVNTPSLNGSFTSGLGIDGSYASTTSTVNLSAVGVFSGGGYGGELAFRTSFEGLTYERMRITKGGDVGIGTSSPSSFSGYTSLTVNNATNGGLVECTNGTRTIRMQSQASGSALIGTTTTHDLGIMTAATPRITVLSGGDVGIGTTNPVNKLQSTYSVPASVPAAGASAHGLAVGDAGFGLAAGALNNGNGYIQATRWDAVVANYNLLLQPNGGNVGIGTTAPIGVFSVRVATNANFSVGTTGTELLLGAYNDAVSAYVPMQLYASEFNLMSGNVGIGTTSPDAPLSFVSSLGVKINLYDNLNYDIGVQTGLMQFIVPSGGNAFGFGIGSSGSFTEWMRVVDSDILVGTTAPGGSTSNTARVVGGRFSTFNATPSIPHNTATTVATLPSGEGMYLVSVTLQGSSTPTDYNELALVRVSQSTAAVSAIVSASIVDITVSGLNVQVTQAQGATQTCPVAIIRLL